MLECRGSTDQEYIRWNLALYKQKIEFCRNKRLELMHHIDSQGLKIQ